MMESKIIPSLGIDIGTTTTQVIFSKLTVVNRAPASQVPVYEFIDREISYQSPVIFTPINHQGVIDEIALKAFIDQQIEKANFQKHQIETGAIIITGETAKAQNAKDSLLNLSEKLGDFVVATAGPHLESVIAGRGSGAQEYSQHQHAKVMNIDIGGGTANYVVFDCGRVVDTACLNIGGRLIELDCKGKVVFIHQAGSMVIQELFGESLSPREITQDHLTRICHRMAQLVVEIITGKTSKLAAHLLQTPELKNTEQLDAIFISGGVGECYFNQQVETQFDLSFGDIGPMLAKALLRLPELTTFAVKKPKQTVRATVIGAGAHSLSLSGSTIWLNLDALPMKNIPVLHPFIDWQSAEPNICQEIVLCAERMDLSLAGDIYAIAINSDMPLTYKVVKHTAYELSQFYRKHGNHHAPAIIIVQNDLGKVLGMELQPSLAPQALAVIDEVITREGDYIDIGKSYFGGEIVPLTIKSLAFPS